MAKFVMGTTRKKGCSFCGKPLFKVGASDQTLVLDGSGGDVAACSRECAGKYEVKDGDVRENKTFSARPAGKVNRRKVKKK